VDLVARGFRIPMRIEFRGLTERAGVLVEGPSGWGEFSVFPDYPASVARRWQASAREAAVGRWPPAKRDRIPVNVTVPAVPAETAHALVAASGCATAKVKVGEGDDIERVAAVRDALGPSGRIRVDVNGGWDVEAAARNLRRLGRFGLEYAEQPVATLAEMAELRKLIDVPLAADESVRTAEDPLEISDLDAADIVVLKVQPLGGVGRALEVAERAGLPAVVSSALETSVGLAAGVALAAALPELPYACGLGTAALLAGDVVAKPLVPEGGLLQVRRPAVDDDALAPFECDPEPWLARVGAGGWSP
jgi:o-succinylbenzoate synthase